MELVRPNLSAVRSETALGDEPILLEGRHLVGAGFHVAIGADEESDLIVAAIRLGAVARRRAILEGIGPRIFPGIEARRAVDDALPLSRRGEGTVDRRSPGHAVGDVATEAPVVRRIVVGYGAGATLCKDAPVGRSGSATFGLDDDDAVRGRGSVERGSRRALDDVEGLDLFRVDRRQTVLTDSGDVARLGLIAEARAVDNDERFIATAERTDAANTNVRRTTDDAVGLQNLNAGRAALQQLADVRDGGRRDDRIGLDRGDDVSDFTPRH